MVRLYNAYIRIFGKLIHRNDTTEIKVVEDILRYRSKRRGKKTEYYQFLSQISDQKRAIYPHRSANRNGLPIIATDSVRRNQKVSRRRK